MFFCNLIKVINETQKTISIVGALSDILGCKVINFFYFVFFVEVHFYHVGILMINVCYFLVKL